MLKKFSFEYVKKNPVMFGVIFVVFGLLLWVLINRGGGASGSTQYVSSGPSEALQGAQLQAGTQVQLAQIQAQTQNAGGAFQLEALTRQLDNQAMLAGVEMQYRVLELGASERLTELQTGASLAALTAQLSANRDMAADNNAFALGYAKQANDAAVQTVFINSMLQRELGSQQLEAYKYGLDTSVKQGILSTIPSLKKKNRDDVLRDFIITQAPSSLPAAVYWAGQNTPGNGGTGIPAIA